MTRASMFTKGDEWLSLSLAQTRAVKRMREHAERMELDGTPWNPRLVLENGIAAMKDELSTVPQAELIAFISSLTVLELLQKFAERRSNAKARENADSATPA